MINKESHRRKIEGSKKESRRQTKKEIEGERESRRYAKKDRGERQKVEDRERKTQKRKERKRLKRIGSEKTKMKTYMFDLEREQIATKERRKETTELRSARYICGGELSSRDPRITRISIFNP